MSTSKNKYHNCIHNPFLYLFFLFPGLSNTVFALKTPRKSMQHCNFCGNIVVVVVNNNNRPTLILTYQKNNTYNSHCSHQSTDSVAFSLTEVWYFSLPKAIVTKASFVPERKKIQ